MNMNYSCNYVKIGEYDFEFVLENVYATNVDMINKLNQNYFMNVKPQEVPMGTAFKR